MERSVEAAPVGKEETAGLARRAWELYVKHGQEVLHFEAGRNPITDAEILAYLVHDDGQLRVPVLVRGGLLVRGYTEELYARVFGGEGR